MKKTLLCMAFAITSSAYAQNQQATLSAAEQASLTEARQYLLGIRYPRDPQRAISLLRQSADGGSTAAMIELGLLYKNGVHTATDHPAALQWFAKAATSGNATGWYHLGMLYKEGRGSSQDLARAYGYFEQGASAGDAQSRYAKGYMRFKGLGTHQDYQQAVQLFTQTSDNPASMYFLGLCYRNGYGVQADTAVGTYWLKKAQARGYALATRELKSAPENSNTAAIAIAAGQQYLTDTAAGTTGQLDQFPAGTLSGKYEGYLIRYDWSGTHAITASRLVLNVAHHPGRLEGTWQEEDSIHLPLQARLTPAALIFEQMTYEKKDHYSPDKAMPYRFDTARLRWSLQGNQVLLQGPITLFSLQRNEPDKPLMLFLKKDTSGAANKTSLQQAGSWAAETAQLSLLAEDGKATLLYKEISAYPNPFDKVINLRFGLLAPAHVVIRLLDVAGKVLYRHDAGVLTPGNHTLQMQPQQKLRAGTYLLQLEYGSDSKTLKIVKP